MASVMISRPSSSRLVDLLVLSLVAIVLYTSISVADAAVSTASTNDRPGRASYVLESFKDGFKNFVHFSDVSRAVIPRTRSAKNTISGILVNLIKNENATTVLSSQLKESDPPYNCIDSDTLQFRYKNPRNAELRVDLSIQIDPSPANVNSTGKWYALEEPIFLQQSDENGNGDFQYAAYALTTNDLSETFKEVLTSTRIDDDVDDQLRTTTFSPTTASVAVVNSGQQQKQQQQQPRQSDTTSNNIRLDRIRGWKMEFTVIESPILESNADDDEPDGLYFYLDRIECIGDGAMFGNALTTQDDISESVAQKTWSITDSNEEGYVHTLSNANPSSIRTDYKVTHAANWGGFVAFNFIQAGNAFYDLSNCNAVSLSLIVHGPSTLPGRTHLRFMLADGINSTPPTSTLIDSEVVIDEDDCLATDGCRSFELYYSFIHKLDDIDTSRQTVTSELVGSHDSSSPFWLTGWTGEINDRSLDKSNIVTYTIEINIDNGGQEGSVAYGNIEFGNLTAAFDDRFPANRDLLPDNYTLDTVNNFNSSDGYCMVDDGVYIDVDDDTAIVLTFQHKECCSLCDEHPECLYHFIDGVACKLIRHIPSDSISLVNSSLPSTYEFRSQNSVAKRGDFCVICDCIAATETIDCTNRDLLVIPILFSPRWVPKKLLLYGNAGLTYIGRNTFETMGSIMNSLEMIVLPKSIKYIHPESLSVLRLLQTVRYEDDHNMYDNIDLATTTTTSTQLETAVTRNIIVNTDTDSFIDVCCTVGTKIHGIHFCMFEDSVLGIDAEYYDFVEFIGQLLLSITPDAIFLSEAVQNPRFCAEACEILEECNFFTYDGRVNNAYHRCFLYTELESERKVCCDDSNDYSDVDRKIPGYVSGISSTERHNRGAAVLIYQNDEIDLVVKADDVKSGSYQVSLATMPMRGAVWIEPEVLVGSPHLDIVVSPTRVVLYDNATIASVVVSVRRKDTSKTGYDDTIFIANNIIFCDAAFGQSEASKNNVVVHVSVPQSRTALILIVTLTSLAVLILSTIIAFVLRVRAKKLSEDAWMINADDLVYGEPAMCIGQGSCGRVYRAQYRGTDVAVKKVLPDSCTPGSSSGTKNSRFRSSVRSDVITSLSTFSATQPKSSMSDVEDGSMFGNETKQLMFAINDTPTKSKAMRHFVSATASRLKHASGTKDEFMREKFIDEIKHLAKLRHPSITTVIGAVIKKNEPQLVLEYMIHGSLRDLVLNKTIVFNGDFILQIIRDIAQGVRFLHASAPPIVHGDLKGANILLDSRFHAKVADFVSLSGKKKLSTAGTLFWMAPELLRGETLNTPESDVYSFGMILFEIYSRSQPYHGENWKDVLQLVVDTKVNKRPPIPHTCPHEVKILITRCFSSDAFRRPTFEDIDILIKGWNAATVEPVFDESDRTKEMSYEDFPVQVEKTLREGRKVEPESKDSVTVLISEICNYKKITAKMNPSKASNMLERLNGKLKELAVKHDVLPVKTNDDTYMVISNLAKDQDNDHVNRMTEFAIEAVMAATTVSIDADYPSNGVLSIRVGIHSGAVVASVVGNRYCLFGEGVIGACRLATLSSWNRVLCSEHTKNLLDSQVMQLRYGSSKESRISISKNDFIADGCDKGEMPTYWVTDSSDKRIPL